MTLTTPAPNMTTNQGNAACTGGQGKGAPVAPANAVSTVVITAAGRPHPSKGTGIALAGITEGAQNNIAATIIVVTILRRLIVAPGDNFDN